MELLFQILLVLHIISGFTALLIGIIPMYAPKGSKLHNRSGMVYFWAMFGVFLTSQPMAFIKGNVFLFTIGIFSFYLVFTGYIFAKRKGGNQPTKFDKVIIQLTFVTSLIMFLFAGYYAYLGLTESAIILGVFASISFGFSASDWRRFGKKSPPKQWMILHLSRMIGAYTATFTAFAATNLYFLPTLAIWLLPTLFSTIGIALSIKHFRKKFGIKKDHA